MKPDLQIKDEELRIDAIEDAPAQVRGLELRVEDDIRYVEELQRQLMAAELAASQEREQQEKGKALSEQIAEVGGS